MSRIIILIITTLVVWSTLVVSANDCRVRDKYSPELWNGDSLKLLAFTSDQDGFTCMLNFQRLDNYLFYDQIVLSNTGNKVIRTDHGNIEYLDIHSSLNDTGWNEFIFSIDDNSIFMAKVRDELVLNYTVEYPVKTITTYGSNISLCSNPTWAVGEYEAIVIPLYPRPQGNEGDEVLNPKNSSIYLTLSSTASFNPIIKVDGIKRFLTMKNGEILLSQGLFQPLRLKKYLLEVHTQKQNINIICKLGNDSNKLMEFQVATVLSDIEISSQGMSFTVDLDISSILFTSTTTTTPTTITTKTPSALAVDSNDETSTGLVVGIVIAVLALLALVVIIIFYKKRKRLSKKTLSLDVHEETQQDDKNFGNSKTEMEIFIDDKNLVSSHEQKQHYDGNKRISIPEMVTLLGNKDRISLQDENHTDDGNCSRSANDLEILSENGEGARSQEDRQTVAKNDKINTNDVEKSFERTEDKRTQEIHQENTVKGLINSNDVENSLQQTEKTSLQDENNSDDGNCSRSANDLETLSGNAEGARSQEVHQEITVNDIINIKDVEKSLQKTEETSDDMDGLEIPSERQSDLKDTGTCDDWAKNKEQESGALPPPHELQSTIRSSSSNSILRDHPPPIDQRPSLLRADIIQGPLPDGAQPANVAPLHVNLVISPPNFTPQPKQIHPHTYLSTNYGESRIESPIVLSKSEVDKRINHNKQVHKTAIEKANQHISLGEYANAREALVNALILINQSKVTHDDSSEIIIRSLQDKLNGINSKIEGMFNPHTALHPHAPFPHENPNTGNSDQFSLLEGPSTGYHLKFPQDRISIPTNDSKSAGVMTRLCQNEYPQELGSTTKRGPKRVSNKQQYATTARSFKDDRDHQMQVKPEENLEQLKQIDADKKEPQLIQLLTSGEFPNTIQQANNMGHLPQKNIDLLEDFKIVNEKHSK